MNRANPPSAVATGSEQRDEPPPAALTLVPPATDELDDQRLRVRAASGDGDAWSSLVDAYAPLVWTAARRHGLSGAQAAEVSGTVWLRFAQQLLLPAPEPVAAWMLATVAAECHRTRRAANVTAVVDPL